jgi:choice-of-anchor B domain-containing protein
MKKYFLLIPLFVGILLTGIPSNAQGPKNLTILDTLNIGQTLAGVWHYRHASGSEYALVGASEGICIIDITDPTNASLLMQFPGVSSIWHEVKVLGDYAYAVSEGFDTNNILNGLQIIDLRYLPDSAPTKFYTGDGVIANQLMTAHTVTVDGETVYVNGHSVSSLGGGVLFLNVSDPWNPVFNGSINNNYCHDSYVRDNYIYTSDIYNGQFSIYNITNQSAPILEATQLTPGLFNHNTWLSDDGNTIYAADEKAAEPLASFDISDLGNISLLDTFFNGNFPLNEVHNVRVLNDYLICPSYGSQLTIVDAFRPGNLVEIANYPTGGYLCWDADPYTTSGNILATDMTGIFYIFAPTYQRACYLEGTVIDSVTGISLNGVDVVIQGTGITTLTNPLGKFHTGYADAGTYTVSFSKAGYVSQAWNFNLANGVLDTIHVKLVPIGAGINDVYETKLEVYPNPASDKIIIATNGEKSDYMIYDALSKVVATGSLNSSETSVDIKNLSTGKYLIKLFTNSGTTVSKSFIKQ